MVQPLAIASQWDQEARDAAWRNAREIAQRDPEAASVLLTHLERTAATAHQRESVAAEPLSSAAASASAPQRNVYNPTRLYALVIRARGWSWRDCQECHFPFFFGLLREMAILDEEEEQRTEAKMAQTRGSVATNAAHVSAIQQQTDLAQIMAYANQPRAWGE